MAVVEAAMKQAGMEYSGLGAVAVSVGPGSFTGVRVGVSAARGFAMALKIPAIGVTTLEAHRSRSARKIWRAQRHERARRRPRRDQRRHLR